MKHMKAVAMLAGLILCAGPAAAQIKIGVSVSSTGPAASLGIPEKNAVALMPKTMGGKAVEYVVLDDASDTTSARRNIEKLVTDNHVDIVLGSSTTPNTLAMIEVAGRSKTPLVSLAAGILIIEPMDDNRRWVFKVPFNDATTAQATAGHMARAGAKTAALISFADAYGESWSNEFIKALKSSDMTLAAYERYNREDTSVTAQVLKVIAARPDAVLIVASGTPGVLPQATLVERGYKGRIYQTTGVTNNDFVRVGGKQVEGTLIAAAPIIVANDLPEGHPAKGPAVDFKTKYETTYGAGSIDAFSGYGWHATMLMENAITQALKQASPGTAEFRAAIRDALEGTRNLATTDGIVTMSATDHNGLLPDAPAIITIKDGRWRLAQ
jgi:branched-chain amino acid transport system substrate-binding protein